MKSVKQILSPFKVIPVIVVEHADEALRLAEILLQNELPVMEITFRSSAAEESIAKVKDAFPEIVCGAGTLLKRESFDRAAQAGAEFFVAPGFNPKNVEYALTHKLPFVPGISSPSLAEQAMEYGLDLLKFFPAEISGGTAMIKALGSVYRDLMIMPTGGISLNNLKDYLALSNVSGCGGSYMVSPKLIKEKNWVEIDRLIKESRKIIEES